jgi:ABC-type multidrug transport system fused ATPase/permease subunit
VSTYYDEDELDDNISLNTGVFKRLLKVVKPYWPTMVLAIIAIASVSLLDALYAVLNKRIIDEGIVAKNLDAMIALFKNYGMVVLAQVVAFFVMIYVI